MLLLRADRNAPFHVPPLGTTERKDTVLRKDIQTQWVDTFLIDDDKVLLFLFGVNCLITNKVLELDDLPALGISEAPLGLHKLFTLFR